MFVNTFPNKASVLLEKQLAITCYIINKKNEKVLSFSLEAETNFPIILILFFSQKGRNLWQRRAAFSNAVRRRRLRLPKRSGPRFEARRWQMFPHLHARTLSPELYHSGNIFFIINKPRLNNWPIILWHIKYCTSNFFFWKQLQFYILNISNLIEKVIRTFLFLNISMFKGQLNYFVFLK